MSDDLEKKPLNADGAPAEDNDNTKTRKTMRLRPTAVPPMSINLRPYPGAATQQLDDPKAARDTDTGNLAILSDTQTRKTVKIKPIAKTAIPLRVQLAPESAAPAGAAEGVNTKTRKTVMLKPMSIAPAPSVEAAEGANTKTRKTVVIKPASVMPAPGAKPADGANTQTRKTVVIKPASVMPAPGAKPADGANTQTRKTVVIKPASIVPPPAVNPPATPAAEPADDTKTRKNVSLKPFQMAEPEQISDGNDTSTRIAASMRQPIPSMPDADDDDEPKIGKPLGASLPKPNPIFQESEVPPTLDLPPEAALEGKDSGDDTQTKNVSRPHTEYAKPLDLGLPEDDEEAFRTGRLVPSAIIPAQVKQTPNIPSMPEDEKVDDATIKIARPIKAAILGDDGVSSLIPHQPGASAEALAKEKQQKEDEDKKKKAAKEDSNLVLKSLDPGALPDLQVDDTPAPEVVSIDEVDKSEDDSDTDTGKIDLESFAVPEKAPAASRSYLVMMLVALMVLAAAATITTVQYLNIWQGQSIQLPFL